MPLFSFNSAVAGSTNASLVCDIDGQYRVAGGDEVLSQVRRLLADRVKPGVTLPSPQAVKDDPCLEIGLPEYAVFTDASLDAQHRVVELRKMFRGTVTQNSVWTLGQRPKTWVPSSQYRFT